MEIAQNLREYILRIHRIEMHIAELTVWLRDGYTDATDIDTVQQALCHAHELLAVTMALRAEAVAKMRRRVRSEYWRGWFERARGEG